MDNKPRQRNCLPNEITYCECQCQREEGKILTCGLDCCEIKLLSYSCKYDNGTSSVHVSWKHSCINSRIPACAILLTLPFLWWSFLFFFVCFYSCTEPLDDNIPSLSPFYSSDFSCPTPFTQAVSTVRSYSLSSSLWPDPATYLLPTHTPTRDSSFPVHVGLVGVMGPCMYLSPRLIRQLECVRL